MAIELSAKELDLLQRIDEKEELRPLFFRKVKGLKWFDHLEKRGYFSPERTPKPVPANEEGYIKVPLWTAIEYLVKSAPELSDEGNIKYADKFLQILVEVTNYAKKNQFGNYRTWLQFANIIIQIPYKIISVDKLNIVDYWLDDKYERGIIARVIGEQYVPMLLEENDNYAAQLATRLIEILYKITFIPTEYDDSNKEEALLRFDSYHAKKITEKIAKLAGEKIDINAIQVFDNYLKNILDRLNNDSWSYVWQPAIENHNQNKYRENAENILILAYREALEGYIRIKPDTASEYVKSMLLSDYQTIQRIAIYVISNNYKLFKEVSNSILDIKYLTNNFRHEMWHFFNKNYNNLTSQQQNKILEIISFIYKYDDEGEYHSAASAYHKAIWLSAIRYFGSKEEQLYSRSIKTAKTEPDHPDFPFYMSVGWGGQKSPKTIEELQAMSIDDLVIELANYEDQGSFDEPGLEGLSKVFKQLVKANPINFYLKLNKFKNLDFAYLNEIIEAYSDLWAEESRLPWDDVWEKLLEFCSGIIVQDRFWDPKNAKERESFVANRYWIVSSIGRLIEAGTKSDDYAFNDRLIPKAEKIIAYLLNRETGSSYKIESDAVFVSINSPRGHCLEALINLSLRSCRIADQNNEDHSDIWLHFQHYYDSELDRGEANNPEYEFATLVTNYLPNFLYMSKQWVLENLHRIFNKTCYLKWLCAMQGYSYVNTVYQEIYEYLKYHGDFLKVLNDHNIRDRTQERMIQNIVIAYINNYESINDEQSLIGELIRRKNHVEIGHLIWFIWTQRSKKNFNILNKIFEI